MKKIFYLSFVAIIGMAITMTSCKKEESAPSLVGEWEYYSEYSSGSSRSQTTRTLLLEKGSTGETTYTYKSKYGTGSWSTNTDTSKITNWYTLPENVLVITYEDDDHNKHTITYEYRLTKDKLALLSGNGDGIVYERVN